MGRCCGFGNGRDGWAGLLGFGVLGFGLLGLVLLGFGREGEVGADEDEGTNGALVGELEAGLVAGEEVERAVGHEGLEGIAHIGAAMFLEEVGFGSEGAEQAPLSAHHFDDGAVFDFVARLEAAEVFGERELELLGILVPDENNLLREDAVFYSIKSYFVLT